jgi:hypothetical protein
MRVVTNGSLAADKTPHATQVDKGATGIDSRFVTAGRKKSTVFVITLRNEGSRDGSGFALKVLARPRCWMGAEPSEHHISNQPPDTPANLSFPMTGR